VTGETLVHFLEDTQAEQLLTTKLFILKPRSDLVPRPHLSELLEEDMRGKLTLVLARAGYGNRPCYPAGLPGLVPYLLLWILMPKQRDSGSQPSLLPKLCRFPL